MERGNEGSGSGAKALEEMLDRMVKVGWIEGHAHTDAGGPGSGVVQPSSEGLARIRDVLHVMPDVLSYRRFVAIVQNIGLDSLE